MVQDYQGLERIEVPFDKKKTAKDNKAVFGSDRNWYISKDATEEQAEILRHLSGGPSSETDTICTGSSGETEYNDVPFMNPPADPSVDTDNDTGNVFERAVKSGNSLRAALAIQEHGLPDDESLRTELLLVLGKRDNNNYPVETMSMIKCCPAFAERYGTDRMNSLIKMVANGQDRWDVLVREADISEEERAFLIATLPLTL